MIQIAARCRRIEETPEILKRIQGQVQKLLAETRNKLKLVGLAGLLPETESFSVEVEIGNHRYVLTKLPVNRSRSLTQRERQVADLACRGFGNKAIAERLGVHQSTVGEYLKRIYAKCGVSSRLALAMQMLGLGSR